MKLIQFITRHTIAATTICLVIIALLFSLGVFVAGHQSAAPTTAPITKNDGVFGVVGSPDSLVTWSKKTGINPTMPMEFESWSKNRTLDDHFESARRGGYNTYMITWEPWQPVEASLGPDAQSVIQPNFSNEAIAIGKQDEYIQRFARSVARSGLKTVYIRYAHEMNGSWYPWSNDAAAYKAAWRHIVELFRAAGANNAKFVFATNPNLYQKDTAWEDRFKQYYPGDSYVDYVGSTMINFGSSDCPAVPCANNQKGYSVALFKKRIAQNYALSGKEIIISEMNTAYQDDTEKWLDDVTAYVRDKSNHIYGVVLSQAPSRAADQMKTGNLSWNISDTPELYPALKRLIEASKK